MTRMTETLPDLTYRYSTLTGTNRKTIHIHNLKSNIIMAITAERTPGCQKVGNKTTSIRYANIAIC